MLTGALRCLPRWRKLILAPLPGIEFSFSAVSSIVPVGLEKVVLRNLWLIQERWCQIASSVPSVLVWVCIRVRFNNWVVPFSLPPADTAGNGWRG